MTGASLRDRDTHEPRPAVAALRVGIASAWFAFRRFDLRYWLRSRLLPRCRHHVVHTGLTPGWHDTDTRLLHACMALLCQYVEDEQGGEVGFPNLASGTAESDGEALVIYRWWKHERQPQHDQYHADLMAWAESRESSAKLHALEDELDRRDQEMLHRLIEIRRSLWT